MHYIYYSSIFLFSFFHTLRTNCNFIIPLDELFIQNISLEIKLQCKLLKNIYIYIQKYSFHYATRNYIRGMILTRFLLKMNDKKNERTNFNSCVANSNSRTKLLDFDWKYYGIKTQLDFQSSNRDHKKEKRVNQWISAFILIFRIITLHKASYNHQKSIL